MKAAVGAASALEAFDDHTILLLLVHRIMLLAVPTAPLNASCTENSVVTEDRGLTDQKDLFVFNLVSKVIDKIIASGRQDSEEGLLYLVVMSTKNRSRWYS